MRVKWKSWDGNSIYQDNQSAIKMEINRRNYCTSNLRHVNIWYLLRKNRFEKGEVKVEYFPTHKIFAEFFTKPLHRSLS